MTATHIDYEGMTYALAPRLTAWLEVEDEIGALPALQRRLSLGEWRVAEVVAAFHILLHHAGCEADYIRLGEALRRKGISRCSRILAALLATFLDETASSAGSDSLTIGGKAA